MDAEIFWRINTEAAADDKVVGEKHAPIISFPEGMEKGKPGKVRIDVGGGKHPNLNEHHIQWVELRINGMFIARAEFCPVVTQPIVEFTFTCPGRDCELSAIARCNLHGLWETKVKAPCCCKCG
ncbi:MAG: superoxide reductase [Candidatus Hydrogenedentes bacterium]|nr:superoxide reductase [Candidatus Hydrogenedentota bacterium]